MALRIRFQHPTDSRLSYSVERLSDGTLYDFADGTFKAGPATPTAPLPEDSGLFKGRYKATLAPTPASQFTDGDYTITVHDQPQLDAHIADVVAELTATMHDGDDATVIPRAIDPWAISNGVLQGLAKAISNASAPTNPATPTTP